MASAGTGVGWCDQVCEAMGGSTGQWASQMSWESGGMTARSDKLLLEQQLWSPDEWWKLPSLEQTKCWVVGTRQKKLLMWNSCLQRWPKLPGCLSSSGAKVKYHWDYDTGDLHGLGVGSWSLLVQSCVAGARSWFHLHRQCLAKSGRLSSSQKTLLA